MSENKEKQIRTLQGEVVSAKMDKTIVVKIVHSKLHPKYKKQYFISKKYKVHDEKHEAKVGNIVDFVECRPISKEKRWRLINIVK